jgi:hypothetical protein
MDKFAWRRYCDSRRPVVVWAPSSLLWRGGIPIAPYWYETPQYKEEHSRSDKLNHGSGCPLKFWEFCTLILKSMKIWSNRSEETNHEKYYGNLIWNTQSFIGAYLFYI